MAFTPAFYYSGRSKDHRRLDRPAIYNPPNAFRIEIEHDGTPSRLAISSTRHSRILPRGRDPMMPAQLTRVTLCVTFLCDQKLRGSAD